MAYSIFSTPDEILCELGKSLKAYRIQQGLSQAELARRSGIGTVAVSHMESGKGSSLLSFICVLRTLGLESGLEKLVPGHVLDPLTLTREAQPRQRVKHARRRRNASSAT